MEASSGLGPPGIGAVSSSQALGLLTRMDEIKRKRVTWLWRDRIPRRAVTLLAGVGGLGKSQLTLAIAGELTRGELTGNPDSALLLSAEDDLEAVVKPRIAAAGADETRVYALKTDRDLWLPDEFELLDSLVRETGARLIVIDPLMAYVDGNTDTHRDRDVRVLIKRLHGIAAAADASVLAVMHFKKGAEVDALYRVSGAAGFGNAARSVLAAARDPNDETQRVIVHAKNNYGTEQPVLRFHIEDAGEGASRVVIGEEDPSLSAADVFGNKRPGPGPESQVEAMEFLRAALDAGPRDAKEVTKEASAAGISRSTLNRAKLKLGVQSHPTHDAANRITGWTWAEPPY